MFTLEIKGRAIAVIDADDASARELAEDDAFQEDLQSLESNGEKLWNGTDPLVVRRSTPEEIEAGEAALEDDEEDLDDDEDAEGGIALVFIVPLDDDLED